MRNLPTRLRVGVRTVSPNLKTVHDDWYEGASMFAAYETVEYLGIFNLQFHFGPRKYLAAIHPSIEIRSPFRNVSMLKRLTRASIASLSSSARPQHHIRRRPNRHRSKDQKSHFKNNYHRRRFVCGHQGSVGFASSARRSASHPDQLSLSPDSGQDRTRPNDGLPVDKKR